MADPEIPELTPTPVSEPLTQAQVWDETRRPTRTVPPLGADYIRRGRAAAASLKRIHDHLRGELATIRDLVEQVARGELTVHEAHVGLNEMSVRQNNWALGAYCASYCHLVAAHHGGEDREIFPNLRWREPGLAPVLERLQHEHVVIHELLDAVDRALVALVGGDATVVDLRSRVDTLSDALLSHLAYEETHLLEAFARYYA